jgi:hypothetical protein
MGVSNEPENRTPTRAPSGTWISLLVLAVLIAGVLVAVYYMLPQRTEPDMRHHTRWPIEQQDGPHPYEHRRPDFAAAERHLSVLAEALLKYRDDHGGGLRWPWQLDELRELEFLQPDFELIGKLSGRELVYQPDMPPGQPPESWVMVHDIQMGWVYPQEGGRPHQGIVAAAVILGDGTVKTLGEDDLNQYAGLQGEFGIVR